MLDFQEGTGDPFQTETPHWQSGIKLEHFPQTQKREPKKALKYIQSKPVAPLHFSITTHRSKGDRLADFTSAEAPWRRSSSSSSPPQRSSAPRRTGPRVESLETRETRFESRGAILVGGGVGWGEAGCGFSLGGGLKGAPNPPPPPLSNMVVVSSLGRLRN